MKLKDKYIISESRLVIIHEPTGSPVAVLYPVYDPAVGKEIIWHRGQAYVIDPMMTIADNSVLFETQKA